MEPQDTNFNYKITSTVLVVVFTGILFNGYYSYAQSNNTLKYLEDKYEKTEQEIQELQKNKELTKELKSKSYLQLENAEGLTNTNKVSAIEKLRGCITILDNPNENEHSKVIYLQFLDPDMKVIKDNSISVEGSIYSKRVELMYLGEKIEVCDTITVSKGSLEEGIYTLNIFEDERLLSSTEFQLK